MTIEPKMLHVPPESELTVALENALRQGRDIVVDTGAAVYPLHLGERTALNATPPTPEEVERMQAAIAATAGAWKDMDAEALKAYLRERRHAPSMRYGAK